MYRRLLHISVPEFPVAVERVVTPSLRDRPVAVTTSLSSDGRVVASSREASCESVFPSLSVAQAIRRCPGLVVLPYNGSLYHTAYHGMLQECKAFSPLIEPYRHGHAYLDISGMGMLMGRSIDMAFHLCGEIRQKLRIPAHSGIGNSKLVSRVADMVAQSEPVFEVLDGSEQLFLEPLSVRVLTGFAGEITQQLIALNLRLVRDITAIPIPQLVSVFGNFGYVLFHRARGVDPSPLVLPEQPRRLEERTRLSHVTNDLDRITREVIRSADRLLTKLRELDYFARRAELSITYVDRKRNRRFVSLTRADYAPFAFIPIFSNLTQETCTRRVHVEEITLCLSGWSTAQSQMDLFDVPSPRAPLMKAIDRIRERFSFDSVLYGAETA
jgi:DNA polymerase-4